MLSEPKHGWSTLTIGDFTARVSYLVDIPLDWGESLLKSGITTLYIDEEGSEVYITLDHHNCFAVRIDDTSTVHELKCTQKEFIETFINDIEKYKQDWIEWYTWNENEDERKIEINDMLRKLKRKMSR